jgi:hypothetical protein
MLIKGFPTMEGVAENFQIEFDQIFIDKNVAQNPITLALHV